MLPQTVKLFRFMNINAHPAKGGGGSSVARGWRGQRSHHKRAAWEYRTQRCLQLQPQIHSKHGAIVVVVVVVLAVIDSRTSLPPNPLPLAPAAAAHQLSLCCNWVALFVGVVGLRFSFALYRIYQLIKIRAFYI